MKEEVEATLAICSEEPAAVATRIADLATIADCQLLPRQPETIHDLYFDTPDRALRTQRLALRVRQIGAARWIALKGPSRFTDSDFAEQPEIERPWSKDAVAGVAHELMRRGIALPQPSERIGYRDAQDVMSVLGLQVVQHRETQRHARNVVRGRRAGAPVLAELAIDRVVYHFGEMRVRHYEVEIEAKADDDFRVLKAVIKRLTEAYEPALRRWNWGKLVTGAAVEKLLREGALEGLLDVNHNLKPAAYDKIGEYLAVGHI